MKKVNLFLVLFCCLLSTSVIIGETMVNKSCDDIDEIDLSGNLPEAIIRSSVKPIQAFVTDQIIEIDFNTSIGTIAISIYDQKGSAVYQQSVNTYAGQQIFIDISSFDEGEYTIEFVNSKKEFLIGAFEI